MNRGAAPSKKLKLCFLSHWHRKSSQCAQTVLKKTEAYNLRLWEHWAAAPFPGTEQGLHYVWSSSYSWYCFHIWLHLPSQHQSNKAVTLRWLFNKSPQGLSICLWACSFGTCTVGINVCTSGALSPLTGKALKCILSQDKGQNTDRLIIITVLSLRNSMCWQ